MTVMRMKMMINPNDILVGLNDEQLKVVLDLSHELIVPAGAGSGKTKTLVTKLIYLLLQGHQLEEFLVLTFTKKAASEMKERIKSELTKLELFDLVNKVDSANISTFDSYAFNLVKQNATLLGLDSNLEMLDDTVFYLTKRELIKEEVLKLFLSKHPEDIDFLNDFTDKLSYDRLLEELLSLFQALKVNFENLEDVTSEDIFFKDLKLINTKRISDLVLSVSDIFYEDNEEKLNDLFQYGLYLEGKRNTMPSVSNKRFKWPKMASEKLKKNFQAHIKKIINPLENLQKAQAKPEDFLHVKNKLNCHAKTIKKVLVSFDNRLDMFKKEVNKYDFDDISKFLIKLVKIDDDLRNRLRNKLRFIFIDEYQDTSQIQTDFLDLMIKDHPHLHVMYVGDIKQSIYKFRNAVPQTFIDKQQTAKNISLVSNYRSQKSIIDFVNHIFSHMMTDQAKHDIVYKNNHEMVSKANPTKDLEGVFLLQLNKNEDDKKHYAYEAFAIAKKILNLYEQKQIKSFKEVAILARNKKDFDLIYDVFKYFNIPLEVQIDFDINQDYLLKLLANILSFSMHINQINEHHIDKMRFWYASIARSSIFNMNELDLFEDLIVINEKSKLETQLKINEQIYFKALELNKIISYASNMDIIESLLNIFDIEEAIIPTYDYDLKTYQIEFLKTLSKTLSDLSIHGNQFVEYIYDVAYDDTLSFKKSLLKNDERDAVVMTNIHQSKGLEYDYLFCINLDKKFSRMTQYLFRYSKETKLLMKPKFFQNEQRDLWQLILKTYQDQIHQYKYDSELKEELRLLYVALTRAKKGLFLPIFQKDNVGELTSFRDYLITSKLYDFIESDHILDYTNIQIDETFYEKLRQHDEFYPPKLETLEKANYHFKDTYQVNTKASIDLQGILSEKMHKNLQIGTLLHEKFEYANFKDLHNLKDEPLAFSKHQFKGHHLSEAENFLQEYSFSYVDDDHIVNGIIDLLVIYEDAVHIIDYKTKNADETKYNNQLRSYESYLKNVFKTKSIHAFLYSITDNVLKIIF